MLTQTQHCRRSPSWLSCAIRRSQQTNSGKSFPVGYSSAEASMRSTTDASRTRGLSPSRRRTAEPCCSTTRPSSCSQCGPRATATTKSHARRLSRISKPSSTSISRTKIISPTFSRLPMTPGTTRLRARSSRRSARSTKKNSYRQGKKSGKKIYPLKPETNGPTTPPNSRTQLTILRVTKISSRAVPNKPMSW